MAKDCEQILFVTYHDDGVYQIQCSGLVPGPGHVYCTLIIGEKRCLLIDNGFGDDDFSQWPPEVVSQMQGKQLICAATHGHRDHIGGSYNFPSLYLSSKDFSILPDHAKDRYNPKENRIGNCQILSLEDGQEFDLGGRMVKAIWTPGHTWGSMCFYDNASKIMMTGDTLNRHVFLFCAKPAVPFRDYIAGLDRIRKYDFDKFLGGHHPTPFAREWIDKMADMVSHFDLNESHHYARDNMPESIYMCSRGRGYGDPDYIAFMFDINELQELMK